LLTIFSLDFGENSAIDCSDREKGRTMSNIQNHTLPTGTHYGAEKFAEDWCWGAMPGRWSVAAALAVLASVSLVIWTGVLLALLH
jgi:hypothetical protein